MVKIEILRGPSDQDLEITSELCSKLKGRQEFFLAEGAPAAASSASESHLLLVVCTNRVQLLEMVRHLRTNRPQTVILFVNVFSDSAFTLEALEHGFDDFLTYPFVETELLARIGKAAAMIPWWIQSEEATASKTLLLEVGLDSLIGAGPSFRRVLDEIKIIARTDATVLIMGETGTGKDLCARAIHYTGARSGKPFIPVNCGGIPEELFENEFFGHERGAYTDARERFRGLIHEAEGGTLFLDDVDSLSLKGQAKLLQFLQGGGYMPLGSVKLVEADVRVIGATNRDLLQKVRLGVFREDLYYRLSVLKLCVPPLRGREDDIRIIAQYYLDRYGSKYSKIPLKLSDECITKLERYSWPGNVRELENVIHSAVIHTSSPVVETCNLSFSSPAPNALSREQTSQPFRQAKEEVVARFEREYVERLLEECDGNVSQAARRAGKNRRAFWEIMRKHHLHRQRR